jgi:hypothetical protein
MWLPVERKMLVTAFLVGLIFVAIAQLSFVKYASANPYDPYVEHVQVPAVAYPSITILSPAENNTLRNSSNLTITFKATIDSGSITDVYYKPSWQPNNTTVTLYDYSDIFSGEIKLNLTGIPEGNQTIAITAYGRDSYYGTVHIQREYPWDPDTTPACFYSDSVSYYIIGFTVDTVPPQVSVLELDNKTFGEPEVPLIFTVNETASKITYCLDGQDNVTITGNTTLTGLSDGDHNLTVYATDEAGNVGSSELIYFSVVSFPTTLVVASVITVAVVGVGLLVYFKKRKR